MKYADSQGLHGTNFDAYGPDAFAEHYVRVESDALRDACLTKDFSSMLGALGLEGEFVPFSEVEPPELHGTAASDEWHGLYAAEDVRRMHLVANHPSGLALALVRRMLQRATFAELGARIFVPTQNE